MKNRNETSTRKCSDQAVWMLSFRLIDLNRVDVAVDMPRPVMSASPGAMKQASSCRLSWATQPFSVDHCSDGYWIRREAAFGVAHLGQASRRSSPKAFSYPTSGTSWHSRSTAAAEEAA